MKTLKLAGKTIEVYDDIENLPVTRFHKYNKMLLVDAGIGSDIADFDRHISRIAAFLAKNLSPAWFGPQAKRMLSKILAFSWS